MQQAVNNQTFRQDLFYRINTIEIRLPPLRERTNDIPLLTDYYLNYFNQKYKRTLTIKPNDLQKLCLYPWPGNVHELAHVIERAVILIEGDFLDIRSVVSTQHVEHQTTQDSILNTEQQNISHDIFDLETIEQRTVRAALKHHQGNVTKAEKSLGLTRGAMYRRLLSMYIWMIQVSTTASFN